MTFLFLATSTRIRPLIRNSGLRKLCLSIRLCPKRLETDLWRRVSTRGKGAFTRLLRYTSRRSIYKPSRYQSSLRLPLVSSRLVSPKTQRLDSCY